MRGPDFLSFYLVLLAVAAAAGWVLRVAFRQPDDASPTPALDPYETATLVGGEELALRVAMSELVLRGQLAPESGADRGMQAVKELTPRQPRLLQVMYWGVRERRAPRSTTRGRRAGRRRRRLPRGWKTTGC